MDPEMHAEGTLNTSACNLDPTGWKIFCYLNFLEDTAFPRAVRFYPLGHFSNANFKRRLFRRPEHRLDLAMVRESNLNFLPSIEVHLAAFFTTGGCYNLGKGINFVRHV